MQSRIRTGRHTCFPYHTCASPTETFSLSGGWGQGHRGKPLLHAQHHWVPASTSLPASHHPDISSGLSALLLWAGSPAEHTPFLHCYAQRSLIHYLSPPSVWERQGKGRRELGLEGGVSKSAPAWLLIRVRSACIWTEG